MNDPEETAADVLFLYGEWGLPVDVRRIARRLGIRVIERRWSGLPHAASLRRPRIVVLNKRRPECARRFDLAHELWHFLYGDERGHGKEANRFACNVLMPADAFWAIWRETVTGRICRDGQLDAICARFAVSWTAALMRGKELVLTA